MRRCRVAGAAGMIAMFVQALREERYRADRLGTSSKARMGDPDSSVRR